jgi:RNA polymerase sigma-70 factor (ECF subfamily)
LEQNQPSPCQDNQGEEEQVPSKGVPAELDTGPARDREPVKSWVSEAQSGNRESMENLIGHFQDRIWRRALYRIGDPDEASEVAQEVFILCFRKIGQFRGDAKFWTWLARIVDNQVSNRRSWWRRRGSRVTHSLDQQFGREDKDVVSYEPPDPSPSPRQEVEGRQSLEALNGALGKLSGDHREILLLRFSDGLPYEEIAESLQISLGTVKSRINRARQELRPLMEGFI